MTEMNILTPRKEFAHYRRIRATSAEVFSHFGYTLQNELLELPRSEKLSDIENLKEILKANVCGIDLTTERATREFIIAPLVSAVLWQTKAKLRVRYWIEIHSQLKGSLSYLFSQNENLLLIESAELEKKQRKLGKLKDISFTESGMNKGFTQLGVELIALDNAEETDKSFIYGLISNGNIWQFSVLDRKAKIIRLDLRTFDIFADIEELIQVINGLLERK
jgi:hypothetical protein